MPSVQKPKVKGKLPRRSPAARSSDVFRVSAKDGESYTEILKAMKTRVNPQDSGSEVLSIRRTRREKILLVLRKGGDVSAFEKALDQAVGEKAEIKSLVSKRSLEVRELDETVTREEVVAALCIALGKPDLGFQCSLYKCFGGVQTAVVRLTEADARSLLGFSRLSAWYQGASRRAGILISSPDLSIGDFLETNAGFVWVEVAGLRVYSCYFSPNESFEIFETETETPKICMQLVTRIGNKNRTWLLSD